MRSPEEEARALVDIWERETTLMPRGILNSVWADELIARIAAVLRERDAAISRSAKAHQALEGEEQRISDATDGILLELRHAEAEAATLRAALEAIDSPDQRALNTSAFVLQQMASAALVASGPSRESAIADASLRDALERIAHLRDALERIAHLDETEGAGDVSAAIGIARDALASTAGADLAAAIRELIALVERAVGGMESWEWAEARILLTAPVLAPFRKKP